jgi:hypothetical protein
MKPTKQFCKIKESDKIKVRSWCSLLIIIEYLGFLGDSYVKNKSLGSKDYELIKEAEKVIRYKYGRHHIGAAVRTKSRKIYSAVHVEANVGRITVCGEAMAIGKAISEGDSEFDFIVAVAHPHPHERNFV